jgi:DNA adenine methylase
VLFKKPESKVEIINDINRDLVTLYRCVKHHLPALVEQFKWLLVARDEFERFMATPPETLTDIQRAARFFYTIAATGAPRLNLLRIEEDLSEAHLRLARVFIENRPYDQVIERFDKPGTFFYVDPPYWGNEDDYGKGLFDRDDFERLASLLGRCKGKFLLSLNDKPEVRATFKGFEIEAVKTRYSISAKANQLVGEVLISNYKR